MVEDEEKAERHGFKVQDRRRFSETGDVRPEHRDSAAESVPTPDFGTPPLADQTSASGTADHAARLPLELSFSMFIISLSTQALAHLGEIPNPVDHQTVVDLSAAKEMIDILGILKEKTKGNLDHSESALVDNILYELRLKYVERVRAPS